jgi:DNA (cytosine-5)-methyltransferase 1
MHSASSLSPLNLARIRASRPGGTWRDWPTRLLAACHRRKTGATYPSVYGRMEWGRPAPTITTQCFGYGNGRFGHPEQDRAISLREAAMLQTFPADYRFTPEGGAIKFNKMGRLIGNAVPVRLGEVVAKTLVAHVKVYT